MNKMWTKEEIRKIPQLWETMSTNQMAEHLGVKKSQLLSLVHKMKKNGFTLTRKRVNSYLDTLIKEVKQELYN